MYGAARQPSEQQRTSANPPGFAAARDLLVPPGCCARLLESLGQPMCSCRGLSGIFCCFAGGPDRPPPAADTRYCCTLSINMFGPISCLIFALLRFLGGWGGTMLFTAYLRFPPRASLAVLKLLRRSHVPQIFVSLPASLATAVPAG